MTSRKLIPLILMVLFLALIVGVPSAAADSSHARIIRLSLVTGDVRFAAKTHGDPLADSSAVWETAPLNLPIRQGYVLATDNGRAEVEFENGAVAFLKENTVLQFYDLSLNDGALTTRLVLFQGSASFYVNPANDDYFSVTGGDFTVEANHRATFRLDNYDDGSTVEDLSGRLTVLHKDQTTFLEKGQSLSMKAGDESSASVGRLPEADEFDRWVSGRIDTVSTATTAAMQYTNSPSYAPGFGSLYSYGSWFDCGGYGYGWRPFGAGYAWSPFTDGQWVLDPAFGWTFVSFQPWGWAPYHYGGWLFNSGCGGWFYSPPMLYGYYSNVPIRRFPPRVNPPRPIFHPVTAVFVRNKGNVGVVPMHPLDARGKTPLNLEHGVFSPAGSRGVSEQVIAGAPGQKWETLKSAPKDAFSNSLASTAPPVRVSRTVLQSSAGTRVVSTNRDSSIAYDPKEHRFVNSNSASSSATLSEKESIAASERTAAAANASPRSATPGVPAATGRNSTSPPPRNTMPPPAPRYSGGERGSSAGSRSTWSGSRSSGSSSAGSSGRSTSAPAPSHSSGGGSHGRP
jgi:FecR protein